MIASTSFAGIVITIKLDIGRKNHNCTGIGVCSIQINSSYADGIVNGTVDFNPAEGTMILGIYEKDILSVQPDKIVYFKNKKTVTFDEDFTLPSEFNIQTKISKPLIIKKGVYPITYKNGMFFIEFPL